MTSQDPKQARYERRNVRRKAKWNERVAQYDSFDNITDSDNLYNAFKSSKKGVSWKESVQRYEAGELRNIADTRRKLLAGESVQKGFVEFTLRERGKARTIKSILENGTVLRLPCREVYSPYETETAEV